MDPDYVIQGLYSSGHLCSGWDRGAEDPDTAIRLAQEMLKDPCFEGELVRVITRDGDLVWSSK